METVSAFALVEFGKVSKDLDKNYSVHSLVTFEVEEVIKKCLFAFPYMWVSILVSISGV